MGERHCFITGTDTGVGKTLVTAAMLTALRATGLRCLGMKPVAAGFDLHDGVWRNEDVDRLLAASDGGLCASDINVYALRAAIAPHIAAEQEGVVISIANIRTAFDMLAQRADIVLVEGVGGFRVPLGPGIDTADLAVALGLPVILVVGLRLGCINHALLTAEAIRARGLQLIGWVGSQVDPAMLAVPENLAALDARLGCPRLGHIPPLSLNHAANSAMVATHLQIELLLKGLP